MAIAQTDREYYALLAEGKTLQRDSARIRFDSMRISEDALQQMLAEDLADQAIRRQELEDANVELIEARGALVGAQAVLASAESDTILLRSQMEAASAQMGAQLAQIALLAENRAFLEAEYESWDELLKTTVFSGHASGFLTPEEIEAMLGTIVQQLDATDAATESAIVQFQQSEITFYLCESSIPDAEQAAQAAEVDVASAMEANQRAVDEYHDRAQELDRADWEVALDEQELRQLRVDIQEAEDVLLALWEWLLNNPTYEAWVANGYPDPGND